MVLEKAVSGNLIILTFDRDYEELIFKYKKDPPPAVVYFRTKGSTPEDAGIVLMARIASKEIELEGFFTVI